MRLLLDTHALIWAAADAQRLPGPLREAITDGANVVAVSAASAWEVAIKRARGRIRFPPVDDELLARGGFSALPIALHHAAAVENLPHHHADPFDRLLVVQAQLDNYVLVSRDPAIHQYDVAWVWDGPVHDRVR